MNPVDFSTTPNRTELLAAAEEELARCLRLLVGCLSSVELFDDLPKVRVLDYYPVLPEQPFQVERSHELTLYTRGDLDRPPMELLTVLLHRALHISNAYHWRVDCNCVSYHNQKFRRLAEEVGFAIRRRHSRYGWAETSPSPLLRKIFGDLGLRAEVLQPFSAPTSARHRRLIWHCGLPKLPGREELLRIQSGDRHLSGGRDRLEIVRGAKVHRLRREDEVVPMLRISGKWLRYCGFRESTPMRVVASRGQLIIQARDL